MRGTVASWSRASFTAALLALASGCQGGDPASPDTSAVHASGKARMPPGPGATDATTSPKPSKLLPANRTLTSVDPDAGTVPANWTLTNLGEMPPEWFNRDGASMVQLATGRILMIGGWSPYDPFGPNYVPDVGGGDRVTNEVWKSDDVGVTWQLLLPHDPNAPKSGPGARFPIGHTVGVVTYDGHAVVMGSDGSFSQDLLGEVWHESDNGQTWTLVSTTAPTIDRSLFMTANYQGAIYMMGGQAFQNDPASAFNDVWRSTDGGVTWIQLADAPWSPRGMVYSPVEHNGKLFIVGGGNYADVPASPVAYNGVYAFDGTTWVTVLPEGHSQFEPSFYNAVISLQGRLWLFDGFNPDLNIEYSRAMYSDDDGATWTGFAPGAGGDVSHADQVVVAGGQILRISGSLNERWIWTFTP